MLKLLRNRINPDLTGDHEPWPKQKLFCQIDDLEAMFGGAAGGGKSDSLLMAATQYVDKPAYRGLILRRKSVDLTRSDAILERARSWWMRPGLGVIYRASEKKFIFPSGATIEFGHMNNEADKYNYQGGSWHYIAFDELTQFTGSQYLYLFSRLRRVLDPGEEPLPLRVRSASNPGGVSHYFVRDRFMSLDFAKEFLNGTAPEQYVREVVYTFEDGTEERSLRRFVPSKSSDNFALDVRTYEQTLSNLAVVEREQLMKGNWLIAASGRFKPEWFGRFIHPQHSESEYYQLMRMASHERWLIAHPRDCQRFITIDPAGTEQEKEQEAKGREKSWSVISTWDWWSERGFLFWRDIQRVQREFPDVVELIIETWDEQDRPLVIIETDGIGASYYQVLQRRGVSVAAINSEGKGKLERSVFAQNMAKEGQLWLPDHAKWLAACEAEVFQWQGLKLELADQIDTLSHAAKSVKDGVIGSNEIEWH